MPTISPDRSASGRNSVGASVPRRGWRQRTSASAPAIEPPPSRTTGWYSTRNSPRSRARPSSSRRSVSVGRAFRWAIVGALPRPTLRLHGGRLRSPKGYSLGRDRLLLGGCPRPTHDRLEHRRRKAAREGVLLARVKRADEQ